MKCTECVDGVVYVWDHSYDPPDVKPEPCPDCDGYGEIIRKDI